MAGRQRAVEGGEEERLAPSRAAVRRHAAPERLEAAICPNGVTQEVIEHLAEVVQELRPDVSVVAEQDSAQILDREVLEAAMS